MCQVSSRPLLKTLHLLCVSNKHHNRSFFSKMQLLLTFMNNWRRSSLPHRIAAKALYHRHQNPSSHLLLDLWPWTSVVQQKSLFPSHRHFLILEKWRWNFWAQKDSAWMVIVLWKWGLHWDWHHFQCRSVHCFFRWVISKSLSDCMAPERCKLGVNKVSDQTPCAMNAEWLIQ